MVFDENLSNQFATFCENHRVRIGNISFKVDEDVIYKAIGLPNKGRD